MDYNVTALCGKLIAAPELRTFESGSVLLRILVRVRSETPRRRVDVIPVTFWEPEPKHPLREAKVGDRVFVVGAVQRRFWSGKEGRQSRLEVVAEAVTVNKEKEDANL